MRVERLGQAEPGEQREAVVEHGGHDAGGASDAPQLEGQQGAQGTASARKAVGEAVVIGGEQEQAAEAGAEAARGQSRERGCSTAGRLASGQCRDAVRQVLWRKRSEMSTERSCWPVRGCAAGPRR